MRASHDLSRVSVSFDEPNLVPNAGLLPAAVLAERIGLENWSTPGWAGPARREQRRQGAEVIGSMLAGGDSIEDVALFRAGALPRAVRRDPGAVDDRDLATGFQVVQRPPTRRNQPGTAHSTVAGGAGPADLSASLTIDLDSTIVPVFGRSKQGAAFGYTKVRGYHPQLATSAQTGQVLSATTRRRRRRRPRREELPDRDGQPGPPRRRHRRADHAR